MSGDPSTPVARNRTISYLSSKKVNAAFKSPLRSPANNSSLSPEFRSSPVKGTPIAKKVKPFPRKRPALVQSFQSPLRKKAARKESVSVAEVEKLQEEVVHQEQQIKQLRSEGLNEEELESHIQKLHEYNEIKDIGQLKRMDMKEDFSGVLDETLHSILSDELARLNYDEIMGNSYEELDKSLEDNVISKMPDLEKLFNEIEEDVARLEVNTKSLKKDVAKQDKSEVIEVDDDSQESKPNTSNTSEAKPKPIHVDGLPKFVAKSTRCSDARKCAVEKHTFDSKLGHKNLHVDLHVFAKCKDEWRRATIIDMQQYKDKMKYKVKFFGSNHKSLVQINHLACIEAADTFDLSEISAGCRVVANFKDEGVYSGVVAEACDQEMNGNRLLIFFDDGYAMYCWPKHVYLVHGPQTEVWRDITHQPTQEYIKNYLSTPVREMLAVTEGHPLKVEFHGEWHSARCLRVDASLVEILYLSDNSREWIYRGSMRLEPLYRRQSKARDKRSSAGESRIARAHTGARKNRFEYIDLTRDSSPPETRTPESKPAASNTTSKSQDERSSSSGKTDVQGDAGGDSKKEGSSGRWEAPWERALDKQKPLGNQSGEITRLPKSLSELQGGVDIASHIMNRLEQKKHKSGAASGDSRQRSLSSDSTGSTSSKSKRLEGKRTASSTDTPDAYAIMVAKTSTVYHPHSCNPQCVSFRYRRSVDGLNPLLKPLQLGWTREIARLKPNSQRTAFHVYYRAPCGRACRNMEDVERYFLECSIQNLDFYDFCFDHSVKVQINNEIKPRDAKYFTEDCTNGEEDMPISCVNQISDEKPQKMPYKKHRIPGKGVEINTSPEFMVCCDCTDNCSDRSKCACQQLTVQATSCSRGGRIKADAGYQYKRLYSFLSTGVYECNRRCRCNFHCKNKVVQLGIKCRLQMFKTEKKGWGIRCLDDIVRGTFVCIYTGKIQTEPNANDEGLQHGDEYLAELDHIEVAENQKEAYNENESSGIDSLSEDDTTDDEATFPRSKGSSLDNNNKAMPKYEDTTDTEGEYECVKVTLRRESGTTWSVSSSDAHRDQDNAKQPDPKRFTTGSKKLGYASDPEVSPGLIPDSVRRRRGRHMVARSNPPSMDSSNDSDADNQQCEVIKQPNLLDEDTTDTDSDTNGVNYSSHSSVAIKSTNDKTDKTNYNQPSNNDDGSDEEEINKTRRYFGPEAPYIIDAKQTGNLGRYLNHSCTPNLMVQNVFVDTHDLRFPWVAFFANSNIRAGTELTWDYNYEIGSVPGRTINCYCGSTKCRKRLL